MSTKAKIFTLDDFLKLRGKQKKPVIVYFDKEQWANLTRGLKLATETPLPDNTFAFILTTLPGLPGGLVEMRCPNEGPITGAEGEVRCGGNPGVQFPDDPHSPPQLEFCVKYLRADGSFECAGKCRQTGQKCRLVSHPSPTNIKGLSVLVTYCKCG